MNERLKESLSALLDGEVNELELQRILSYENKQEVSEFWQSYHNVREWVRKSDSFRVQVNVRTEVMRIISEELPPHKA
jgi:sigma-E factor negative regulatory protein RseA